MKKIFIALLCVVSALAQAQDFRAAQRQLDGNAPGAQILVAAHRGDWRHAPENSRQAIENAIAMGVPIVEIDLKMSKDSVLVLCHDQTIDRTMTGKGKVSDFSLAELRAMSLKNGLGRATFHKIITFEECLQITKGKAIVDVDKGYSYLGRVLALLAKYRMYDQAIVNVDDNISYDALCTRWGIIDPAVRLMPIVNLNKASYKDVIDSYKARRNTVFQPVFSKEDAVALQYIRNVKLAGYQVWINSLWPSLNAGHDDDSAVELNKKDESWGWLIRNGATIIQSDRPADLLKYLHQ